VTNLLVVEADVRPPDVIGGNVKHAHLTVLGWVPHEFVVVPVLWSWAEEIDISTARRDRSRGLVMYLLHPEVGRHDLILQILPIKT